MRLTNVTSALLGILLTVLPTNAAFAKGGTDGGGGGAMVKYSRSGDIVSAELIDLWEARNLPRSWEKTSPYKLNIPYPSDPPHDSRTEESVQVYIDRAMAKLRAIDPLFAERVEQDLKFVQDTSNWNKLEKEEGQEEITLPLPKDAKLNYQSSDKVPTGMMFFDEEIDRLSVRSEIFSKLLNNVNIAASFTHEAIYKTLRDTDLVEGDSTEVRKINACLYANDDCFGLAYAKLQPLAGSIFYSCTSGASQASLMLEPPRDWVVRGGNWLGTLQLDHLGSTHYPIPINANFVITYTVGANGWAFFPTFKNQILDRYLRSKPSRSFEIKSKSIVQVNQGTPIVTVKGGKDDSLTLTIGEGARIIWNGVDFREETYACRRMK